MQDRIPDFRFRGSAFPRPLPGMRFKSQFHKIPKTHKPRGRTPFHP